MGAKEGTVYILVNDAMPGFTKLETTSKNDLAARVSKTNGGELPVPFRIFFAAKVPNISLMERNLAFLFADERHGAGSPFYKSSADRLRAAIEPAAIEIVEIDDDEIGISPDLRKQMVGLKGYHDALQFEGLNIEPGTTLSFSKDHSISCTAIGNGMVDFEGTVCTPADAAANALRSLGHDWSEVSATDYWQPQTLHFPGKKKSKATDKEPGMESVLTRVPESPSKGDSSPVMFITNNKV